MRARVSERDLSRLDADLAVCFAYEGERSPAGVSHPELRSALEAEMKAERFSGLATDLAIWNTDGRFPARRFAVVGLGRRKSVAGEAIRTGAARAARTASRLSARRLALRLPETASGDSLLELRAAIEGAMLGAYRFERHLTEKSRRIVGPDSLEVSIPSGARGARRASALGSLGARAVAMARDLVNEGPSRMNPTALSRIAAREGRSSGLRVQVHGERDLRRLGMSALLSVARGSSESARLVHLHYRPDRRRSGPCVVLVGKGVTFDSGGLNLKTADGMFTMKADMAGAAAVLAVMTTLRELGTKVEVHGLLGLVENMTGPAAYKPGDILDTFAGKTVEVGNTDAEGRLVLCDLLAYACARLAPTYLVDVATLTGACVVALGTQASGVFSRNEEFAEGFLTYARLAGEKMWRLPLYEEYLHSMQQGPADLRSTGGRWGGAITAALFLGEFVRRDVPWLHLDIAGPAFAEHDLPEARAGGTGAGVLTLLRWLESLSKPAR